MTEELLDVDDIQGNILAGFNKDHQVFLFLGMNRDVSSLHAVRAWLRAIAPQVSTLAEVHRFNELFRAMRGRLGRDPHGFCATWMNIAFSARAIEALTSAEDVAEFGDSFFTDGLAESSPQLGDPSDGAAEGDPAHWVVGGPHNEADIVIIVASDSPIALAERVTEIKSTLADAADPQNGMTIGAALHVLWEQAGETLPGALVGHEHFGFKDGVSQPGVRGLVGATPEEFVTRRTITTPQDDPALPEFSRPGQPLVHAGQFVFGYAGQDRNDPRKPYEVMMSCPAWGRNGSYLVIRRLRQDVARFRADIHELAAKLGITPVRLASLFVGRWPSGAPLMRAPEADDRELGADGVASNCFGFVEDTPPREGDPFPAAKRDPNGRTCPFVAHVRKINPRDTTTEQGNSFDALARMILRRGIPFGPPYPGQLDDAPGAAPLTPGAVESQRGLMFVSYQTSIENQFVFLQRNWANHPSNPSGGGGEDPIIGQGADDPQRRRFVEIGGETLTLPNDWVIPTGGGFFFSPAISAITNVLARSDA